MSLAKATLQTLVGKAKSQKEGARVPVQFNPASMRIQFASHSEGPRTPTGPAEQFTGSLSTLSLDLHFDTADEGTTASPINVRTRTAEIARYMIPGDGGKTPPPRVRFQWGDLIFEGVVTTMSEDLDLFAETGVPLRAKVSISIQGQDPKFEALATGPGSADGKGATEPGGGALAAGGGAGLGLSAGVGAGGLPSLSIGGGVQGAIGGGLSIGLGASLSAGFGTAGVGVALDGESPSAFAARMGLDPAAWRALAAPGGVDLSLVAGTEIAFPNAATTAPGVGVATGGAVAAGSGALEQVDGPAPASSPREAVATGFALARAGGVDAALQTVRQQRADSASGQERRAFGLGDGAPASASGASGASAPQSMPRGPLRTVAGPGSTVASTASAPIAPPPRADERATSFGRGVPLRPRRAVPHDGGAIVLGRRAPAAAPAPPLVPAHAGDCGCGCGGG